MSPDTISSQCYMRQIQQYPDDNSTESMKHDYCKTKVSPRMLSQSKIHIYNENRRSFLRLKNHTYQNESSISSSRNKSVNANNIDCKHGEQLDNCHNNILQLKNSCTVTSWRQKQSISNDDCELKNNSVTSTIDRSKFNEKFTLMNRINIKIDERLNLLNYIDYHLRNRLYNFWQVAIIIFISLICTSSAHKCASGLKTPGRTFPAGDIILEYGQPLRILCMLNKTVVDAEFSGKNASDLVFFRSNKKMEREFVTIVNETTIEMFIEKPPPSKNMYYCKLQLDENYNKKYETVCLNSVVVGFQPEAPTNLSCIGYNWESLRCSWVPVPNYVETRNDISYRISNSKRFPCPSEDPLANHPNSCLWDISTDPPYRQLYEIYNFTFEVKNVLGNKSFKMPSFHHFAHVIPAKPEQLSIVNKTTESVMLYWEVPSPIRNFPPGLHHRIAYQHQWDTEKMWQVINITNEVHGFVRYYNLTGIKYANTVYDVRVFIKSASATDENKWSNFSTVTFRSPPRLPGRSARTDIGSFEIMENKTNRDVYLYWKAIPSYLQNGDDFKYQISRVEEDGNEILVTPNETTRTYTKFKGISFNSYRFELITTNVMGSHPETASIFVPSQTEMPDEPVAFTKIAFDEGLYELSWKPPIRNGNIMNYTIFWCDNDRDRPYQCTGYLDWVHVPRTSTIYNMTVPDPSKVYQFAISANTVNGSSGMVWASCTVIHNKVIGKMKSVWINQRGSNNISISWKLDCSDRIGNVEGFNIYYCSIVSPRNLNCKEPQKNTTIPAGPLTTSGVVTGLKPYTTYMISVAVLTKNGESLQSNPLHDTTFEAAPATPPQNVTIGNVTNTTMFVSWDPPTAMNGVLRYYKVHYSGNVINVEESTHVLLKELLPFKNYSIRITACTVECSAPSPTIYHLSAIGRPGKIMKTPTVRFINSTHMIIMWSKPSNFGGNLDYYQISSGDGDIRNSTKMEIQLPIPDCKGDGRRRVYYFRVRAVNIDYDGRHIIGPWSDAGENNCYSDGSSFRVYVIIWIISCMSGIIFLLCIAYTSKRMWLKCKAMQDVEVKLPPGLATREKLLQGNGGGSGGGGDGGGEQHIRQSSADSSHCSSGQESVTSSLTSASHVSADSGTEIDPITISQNKLLETSTTWETTSLRQRNVGTTRSGILTDSLRWDTYIKGAKSGDLAVEDTTSLARSTPNLTDTSRFMIPQQQAWSSTGYISMPSSEELTSNPSPVPLETEHTGSYSVVGIIPKVAHSKVEEPSESADNKLVTCEDEIKCNHPYVSLASLEQKPQNKLIGPLHNLDNIAFAQLDQSSKPYVQTGLMDNIRKPFGMNSPADLTKKDLLKTQFALNSYSSNKPVFVANQFAVNPSPLKSASNDTTSKPYVTVGSIPEITSSKSASLSDGNRQYQCAKSSTTNKPYVQASTVFQMLQHQKSKNDDTLCTEESEIDLSSSLNPPIYWQSGDMESSALPELDESVLASDIQSTFDYATSTEKLNADETISEKKVSPYVQHRQLDTQTQSTGTSVSDEPYSKVAVAPHITTIP